MDDGLQSKNTISLANTDLQKKAPARANSSDVRSMPLGA